MIAAACALATIEFAPSGCAAQKPARCSRLRPVSAAQNGRGVCEATTMTHRATAATWTEERVELLAVGKTSHAHYQSTPFPAFREAFCAPAATARTAIASATKIHTRPSGLRPARQSFEVTSLLSLE